MARPKLPFETTFASFDFKKEDVDKLIALAKITQDKLGIKKAYLAREAFQLGMEIIDKKYRDESI